MPEWKVPLFDRKLSAEAKRQVRQVLDSGWLNTGTKAREFETAVARLCGVRYAAAVNSATSGLSLVLESLGIVPGCEVITTPYTFVSTLSTILRTGATPVLADIEPDTLTIDPDEVARKVNPETRAVISVDLAGLPADYKRLIPICTERSIPLVADAAHSFGGGIGKKVVAQLADVAVHSFQATKNLTTGDGGMVLSRHKVLIDQVRLLSQHAMTGSAFDRKKSRRWEYDVVGLGHKANLTDLQAALGLGQVDRFEKEQARRTKIAARYADNLADLDEYVECQQVPAGYRHAWHLYLVLLHLSRLRIDRDQFITLMANAGVECGVHYKPLFEMSFYRELGFTAQYFPNAAYVGRRVVTLPMYPSLSNAQVDTVCHALGQVVRRHAR
jgi:dTDP-4-amino-4,6-dideoxygalactose transaminase